MSEKQIRCWICRRTKDEIDKDWSKISKIYKPKDTVIDEIVYETQNTNDKKYLDFDAKVGGHVPVCPMCLLIIQSHCIGTLELDLNIKSIDEILTVNDLRKAEFKMKVLDV